MPKDQEWHELNDGVTGLVVNTWHTCGNGHRDGVTSASPVTCEAT
jgi:hypothetical protein